MDNNEEKILSLASDVMKLSRSTLLVNMRFLDLALGQFRHIPADCKSIMTDGEHIVYDPRFILKRYAKAQEIPARDYFHMIMHCVFKHMYMDPALDRQYWDIACDIAVENVISELNIRAVKTDNEQKQAEYLAELRKEQKVVTAEKIYAFLRSGQANRFMISHIAELFRADDHSIWYMTSEQAEAKLGVSLSDNPQSQNDSQNSGDDPQRKEDTEKSDGEGKESGEGNGDKSNDGSDDESQDDTASEISSRMAQAKRWQDIAERMQTDMETFGKQRGLESGALTQNLKEVTREKYDYAAFLKKFAVMGEVMRINDEEFDYVYYTYGLKLYDKMPLIEPLEYKDVKRIREFVIAIDTSGSTSGELVQKFLQKTYNILLESESFFSKVNVHIIQCDAAIQEDAKITCREDFDDYLKTMQIRGLGGTDFRPVFQYVDKLIAEKEFTNLKGLIYFTDGFGAFPAQKPGYETAFVFIDNEINNYEVPPWAIKLVLRKNEI